MRGFDGCGRPSYIDILLTGDSVAEGLPAGTLVGTLIAVDPDPGDSHAFELVSGPGDVDNASFEIVGDQLLTTQVFDYKTPGRHRQLPDQQRRCQLRSQSRHAEPG